MTPKFLNTIMFKGNANEMLRQNETCRLRINSDKFLHYFVQTSFSNSQIPHCPHSLAGKESRFTRFHNSPVSKNSHMFYLFFSPLIQLQDYLCFLKSQKEHLAINYIIFTDKE